MGLPLCGAAHGLSQGAEGQLHQLLDRLADAADRETQGPGGELLVAIQPHLLLAGHLLSAGALRALSRQLGEGQLGLRFDLDARQK